MTSIYFDITGNGTAYTLPSAPSVGENFTFYAIAFDSDVFEDVWCTDENGYSIAIPQADTFSMQMPNVVSLTFHVQFSETTPPTPPTPETRKHRMPIWMYPCLRQ